MTQHATLYVGKRENVYPFQIQNIPDFPLNSQNIYLNSVSD